MIQQLLLGACALLSARAVQLSGVTLRMTRPETLLCSPTSAGDSQPWESLPPLLDDEDTSVPPPKVGPLAHGLAFIKTPKCGGSTFAGVVRRIAFKNGLLGARKENSMCINTGPVGPIVFARQAPMKDIHKELERKLPSAFYVSIVRDPAARALSADKYDGTNLFYGGSTNFMVEYTGVETNMSAQEVMDSYHFIAVTERMDESLLVLALMLGVGKTDVLYLPSKVAGSSCGGIKAYNSLEDSSSSVRDAAERFHDGKDFELVALANKALDKAVGRYPAFQTNLEEYRKQLATVANQCADHACHQCMWGDNGCGQVCIDDVIKNQSWAR